MKQLMLGLLAVIGLVCIGSTGSLAAPARGNAIVDATSTNSLVERVVVVRRSVYRATPYGGCRRVRTCGPNGCVYVRRCW